MELKSSIKLPDNAPISNMAIGYFSAVNLTIVSDFLCRKWRLIRNVGIFPPLDYAKDKAHFDVAKAHRLNELSKQIQVYTNQNF